MSALVNIIGVDLSARVVCAPSMNAAEISLKLRLNMLSWLLGELRFIFVKKFFNNQGFLFAK